jgi:hypothetical protein
VFETQAQHALRESGFTTVSIVYQLSTVSCHNHGPIGYSLKLTVANSNEDFQMEGHIASAIRGDRLIIRSAKQSDLEAQEQTRKPPLLIQQYPCAYIGRKYHKLGFHAC